MFSVAGDAGDKRFDFEGNLSGVHWIGAHMRTGQIHIHGPAGRHLGSELRGGEIHVEGDAGDWIGCEMRGGLIHVQGNAGHRSAPPIAAPHKECGAERSSSMATPETKSAC